MVEAAITMVVISLLMFGIVAAGLMARSYAAVQNAAASGARAASVGATGADSDYLAMEAAKRNLSSISLSSVSQFVVYKADAPKDPAPAACLSGTAGVAGLCNVYGSSDMLLSAGAFGAAGYNRDDKWPAASRQASRTQGVDIVGVSITARCDCFTKVFGFDPIITRSATAPIEAQSY